MNDYRLQKSLACGEKLAHDGLEEGFVIIVFLFLGSEFNLKFFAHWPKLVLLLLHNGLKDLEDGVEHKHVERTFELLSIGIGRLCRPLAGCGIEKVVTPKLGNELVLGDAKLLGVPGGKLTKGKTPSVETRSEGDGAFVRINLDVTKGGVVISGDNDIDSLDCALEGLVKVFLLNLELEESTVDLVYNDDGFDAFCESLAQDGFRLDANTFDTVDDHEGTVRDSEGGGDL